jgi:hypothetical protein
MYDIQDPSGVSGVPDRESRCTLQSESISHESPDKSWNLPTLHVTCDYEGVRP